MNKVFLQIIENALRFGIFFSEFHKLKNLYYLFFIDLLFVEMDVVTKECIFHSLSHAVDDANTRTKSILTLVLLRGVVPTPLTVIALVLKIAQPRGKIAPGTFKFILSLHF